MVRIRCYGSKWAAFGKYDMIINRRNLGDFLLANCIFLSAYIKNVCALIRCIMIKSWFFDSVVSCVSEEVSNQNFAAFC